MEVAHMLTLIGRPAFETALAPYCALATRPFGV